MAKSTAPWKQPKPEKTSKTQLTPESIAKAKAAAKRAGRRYPNLVDNMNAARQQRKAEEGENRRTRESNVGSSVATWTWVEWLSVRGLDEIGPRSCLDQSPADAVFTS